MVSSTSGDGTVMTGREIARPASETLTRSSSVRLTAADRPGVAQPVPERDIPERPWRAIFLSTVVIVAIALGAWELYWREYGVAPSYRNSDGQWAIERRRIDNGEGHKTVLIGASRVLFDIQLPAWERVTGERPIQLALEGTSPLPILEDLADDPDFTGRLLVGVAPDVFFTGFSYRQAFPYYRQESPSNRAGTWLSMQMVEPYFAFYDPDYALHAVVDRQAWPERPGRPVGLYVRKLSETEVDRNTYLWDKLVSDASYREMARRTWSQDFDKPLPGMETPEKMRKAVLEQVTRAAAAVAKLRARGVPVIFVRPPSDSDYYAFEEKNLPRTDTWEVLLKETRAPGIHFEDFAQLQGYYLPEMSHLAPDDAVRFTEQLAPLVASEFAKIQSASTQD